MELPRILIADSTQEFREALSEALQGYFHVKTCADGNQALELVNSYRPDVLVVDLMLQGMDGISLLQRIREGQFRPAVLANTRYVTDYVVIAAQRLGVGYMMLQPCDISATVERIMDLYQSVQRPVPVRPDTRSEAANMLLALGVPTKLRGYYQLREAILIMASDPAQSITKELYPAVAQVCDATALQVERSIRSAIRAAWERRDERVWRRYFHHAPGGEIARPSNGEFIMRLADVLQLSMDQALEA